MALKIKWNDDRVRGATTAILLIGRDRLRRGDAENLIHAALTEYRDDPQAYKRNKAIWADAKDVSSFTNEAHAAYYRNLISAIEGLHLKMTQARRQFNSLLELDNWLVASLKNPR